MAKVKRHPMEGENLPIRNQPPYTLSERAVSHIAEIAAALERYKIIMEGSDGLRLRKINHIKTIRGTKAILAGKRVVAEKREIDEIKYRMGDELNAERKGGFCISSVQNAKNMI